MTVSFTIEENRKPGDVNGDGIVDVTDLLEIVNAICGKPSVDFNEEAADLNNDGVINVSDIIQLKKIIVNQ